VAITKWSLQRRRAWPPHLEWGDFRRGWTSGGAYCGCYENRRKYGDKSLKYLNVWTAEFGFPIGGSISLKNISILEEKLKGKEQEMRRKKKFSVKKLEIMEGQKEWLQMWKGEAETRNRKTMQKQLLFSCEKPMKSKTHTRKEHQTRRSPLLCFHSWRLWSWIQISTATHHFVLHSTPTVAFNYLMSQAILQMCGKFISAIVS